MDRILTAGIPILKKFLAGDNEVVLTIRKRGAAPLGGGEIHFKCPISRNLKTIQVLINLVYIFYILYINNMSLISSKILARRQWNGKTY